MDSSKPTIRGDPGQTECVSKYKTPPLQCMNMEKDLQEGGG